MTDRNDKACVQASYDRALALHAQGRYAEAEQMYGAVLQMQPDHVEALHGLGVLSLQNNRYDRAVELLRGAVAAGGSMTVRNNLGVALCAAQKFPEAAGVYREAAKIDPVAALPRFNLGQILIQMRDYTAAADVLRAAERLAPNDGRVHHQLAVALAECHYTDESLRHFERAASLAPERTDILCDWAAMLLKTDRRQAAADVYRRAATLSPGVPEILCGLGEALGSLGKHEEAVSCFLRAIAQAPKFALAYYNLATALTYLGRMDEAEKNFVKAAELEPDVPAYRGALIALKKTTADNANLQTLEAMAAGADGRDPREAMELQFALAKAYDDVGDYARAFATLQRGNQAKRSLDAYDIQEDLDRFRAIARVFDADFLTARAGKGDPSGIPVFIVGMPRSGTTLVEQILASHPAVFGAGEQAILAELIMAGMAGGSFPTQAGSCGDAAWRDLGAAYAQRLSRHAPRAQRITDKLPLNFQLIGLIRLALPQARIVHVMRDPLDTCFSCYFTLFANGLGFRDDLTDLGRYYSGYRALMAHWRRVLPPGAMLEVQYENVVANLEPEARRIVEYCGLEWDARCLKFHETVRPVETASTMQVRKPLYKTSVGRAAHYAPWLEPLRRALDEKPQS